MVMVIVFLVWFGLCLGSFVNALVWRVHKQSKAKNKTSGKLSVMKGRSMCVHCGHELRVQDLIPVVSWLTLRGRCRYCKQAISWQYPLVEVLTAVLFVVSYVFWPETLVGWEIVRFGLWLICLTGLIALVVYDFRWKLLPNRIIFPLYAVGGAMAVIKVIGAESPLRSLLMALASVLIGGGVFYVLFQFSDGRWIGGGDVKLGFLLGAIVAEPLNAVLILFFASLLGSLATVPLLIGGRLDRGARIPFGPFLIIAAGIILLFGTAIIDWYTDQFLSVS